MVGRVEKCNAGEPNLSAVVPGSPRGLALRGFRASAGGIQAPVFDGYADGRVVFRLSRFALAECITENLFCR